MGFFSLGGAVFGADGRGFAAKFATGGAEGATAIGLATGPGATNGAGAARMGIQDRRLAFASTGGLLQEPRKTLIP